MPEKPSDAVLSNVEQLEFNERKLGAQQTRQEINLVPISQLILHNVQQSYFIHSLLHLKVSH